MSDIFSRRRDKVIEQLGKAGALVLSAAPEITVGRDTELRYAIDAEFYYLTGYTEPEAVLVLLPREDDTRLTLFVRPRDPARELWTGVRSGVEGAREQFGATSVYPISELNEQLPKLLNESDVIYARYGAGRPEVDVAIQQILARARNIRPRTGRSPHTLTDPGVILDSMRVIKDATEIERMREAARITRESFAHALQRVHDGVGEWEIEAAVEYGFRSRGADGFAFPTIAAAGRNATTLHYVSNSAIARAGDLLLLDAGARYQMYCADITRTVPVSGTFTAQQKDLHDLVQAAHDAAIRETRPGAEFDAPHRIVQRILAEGLIQLGYLQGSVDKAIEAEDGLKRFYPHRTSHWLGLDVHDVGAYATADGPVHFQPGMVLTIEPGLYLPDLGIGIRIEDDVLVTENSCEVLTE